MNTLTLKLNNKVRPISDILINGSYVLSLYDTGAKVSVWTKGLDMFLLIFPDAEFISGNYKISGFGGSGEYYSLYKLPIAVLSDGINEYIVRNMLIAVSNRNTNFNFSLVLSAGVFGKSKVIIDNCNKILTVEYTRNDYYMTPLAFDGGTTVFTQENKSVKSNIDNPLLRAAMKANVKNKE